MLLDGHRRIVKEDEATDDLGHVVPWGVGVPKRIPVADQDDKTYQQRVKVYKSAKINGVRYGCVISPSLVIRACAEKSNLSF